MRTMREKGKESLHYFNSEVMRYTYQPYGMTAPMHKDMDEWLQDIFTDPRVYHLFLDFRASGKTLKGGVGHTLWRGIRNPNITIRYMHADEEMAGEVMAQMRSHLESNEIFRQLYHQEIFQPTDDGGSKLVVDSEGFTLNRSYAPRTPTLRMLGYKSGKIGTHVDLFILDDLVNEKTTQSLLLIQGVKTFIHRLHPLLNNPKKSRVLLPGTRWNPNDAYGMLIEDNAYGEKRVRQWVKSVYADEAETTSRWPEKFPVETLLEMEAPNKGFFSANMRNAPMPEGTQLFDVEKVRRYDLELDEKMRPKLPTGLPYLVYGAADPNRSTTGDNGAVLWVARDADDNHFVLDLDYGKPASTEFVLWMRMGAQRWSPTIAVFYEAIVGQAMLLPWIKRDMLESGVHYNLQKSTRLTLDSRKKIRIRALCHIINTGKLWVPNSVKFKPLMREIEFYTDSIDDSKDDCLDCLGDVYSDGYSPSGGTRQKERKQAQRVALPWQDTTLDSMLQHTYGNQAPRVTSVESRAYRGR